MSSAVRLVAGVVLALSTATVAAFDEPRGESGWYAGAGARVLKLDGWQEGYGPSVLFGWKLPYQHAETPRSSIALEGEFTGTTESLSRRNGDGREEADILQAGGYLALNTFVGERFFHRVRLGVVAREFDRPGGTRLQGRLAFGLGAGLRLGEDLDVLVDAQTQYWSWPDNLLLEAGMTARWHF